MSWADYCKSLVASEKTSKLSECACYVCRTKVTCPISSCCVDWTRKYFSFDYAYNCDCCKSFGFDISWGESLIIDFGKLDVRSPFEISNTFEQNQKIMQTAQKVCQRGFRLRENNRLVFYFSSDKARHYRYNDSSSVAGEMIKVKNKLPRSAEEIRALMDRLKIIS